MRTVLAVVRVHLLEPGHRHRVFGTMIFCEVDVAACSDAPQATASIDKFLCHLLHGRSSESGSVRSVSRRIKKKKSSQSGPYLVASLHS